MSITKASLIDLNGQELILDADADTSITADTDDQIDIKIAGSDSIRIKANEIENVSGDFTLDVAGDITLDADGADIRLSDGGTQFGKFTRDGGDFLISSSENDKDMKFAGADGGANITALTLDMSSAGAATFNAGATFGGRITATSNHSQLTLTDSDDSKFALISYSGGKYILRNNSTDTSENQFTLTEDGKFGIGTTSPGGLPLQIKVASGDNKFRQTTAAKDAFTLGLDNSTGDTIIGTHTNYPHTTFKDGGNVEIADGDLVVASGHGIDFSATSDSSGTMSNELLDDYEEGTWTPTLVGSHSQSGQVYGTQTGTYTKIGQQVTCRFQIQLTSEGTFGNTYILLSGFPFALNGTPSAIHMGSLYFVNMGVSFISIGLQGYQGNTQAYLWAKKTATASREYVNPTDLSDTTTLTGTFTYFV